MSDEIPALVEQVLERFEKKDAEITRLREIVQTGKDQACAIQAARIVEQDREIARLRKVVEAAKKLMYDTENDKQMDVIDDDLMGIARALAEAEKGGGE